MRKNISTHTPSELRVCYSRAVVFNNTMYMSGTTSVNEKGEVVGQTTHEQAKFCFEKIKKVMEQNGFLLSDIVMVRVFLVNMNALSEFDEVFKKYFHNIKPACTLVGVSQLVDPKLLVEIECTAEKE